MSLLNIPHTTLNGAQHLRFKFQKQNWSFISFITLKSPLLLDRGLTLCNSEAAASYFILFMRPTVWWGILDWMFLFVWKITDTLCSSTENEIWIPFTRLKLWPTFYRSKRVSDLHKQCTHQWKQSKRGSDQRVSPS